MACFVASVSLAGAEVSSNNGAPFTFLEQRKTGLRSETCLDLFVGNKPRAVGKRTPRVPVASMYHRDDKAGPSNRQAKPDANNGDEEGALAALALAEVCQRGSPQVSQTSGRSSGQLFLSPGKSIDRKVRTHNLFFFIFRSLISQSNCIIRFSA